MALRLCYCVQGVSFDETRGHVEALLKGLRGRRGTAYDKHFVTET